MADRLESARMVGSDAAGHLRWLLAFGEMIANTDMHFGNASLVLQDAAKPAFAQAPAMTCCLCFTAPGTERWCRGSSHFPWLLLRQGGRVPGGKL